MARFARPDAFVYRLSPPIGWHDTTTNAPRLHPANRWAQRGTLYKHGYPDFEKQKRNINPYKQTKWAKLKSTLKPMRAFKDSLQNVAGLRIQTDTTDAFSIGGI